MVELKIGLRFFMFGNESNSFSVISFNDTDMFIHSELLNENQPKPYKRSQFDEMVKSGDIEFF